jgi:diguanylate cyclase (GGDEF)-like protein
MNSFNHNQESGKLRSRVGSRRGAEYQAYGMSTTKLMGIASAILVICTAAVLVLYFVARRTIMEEVRRQLISVASTAALQIDPNKLSKLTSRSDESTPTYIELKHILQQIRDANPDIRFIYTMASTDQPGIWQFILDAEKDPAEVSHIGDEYEVSKLPELKKAFIEPIADNKLSKDKWGIFLSGYAPIYNAKQEPIGILGVDMTQANVHRRLMMLQGSSMVIWLIFFSLIILVSVLYYQRTHLLIVHRDVSHQLTDPLTQLANQRRFDIMLDFEFQVAPQYNRPVSLIMGDIDHFKKYNDTYGQKTGDELLRQISSLIQANVRKIELAVRLSGGKFAIILPNSDITNAEQIAERIRNAVETKDFCPIPGKHYTLVTISFGVAAFPTHALSKKELIDHAEDALYTAKQAGRNQTRTYSSPE